MKKILPFDIATKPPQKKTEANMCMPVSAAVKHKIDTRPHVTYILAKQVILNTLPDPRGITNRQVSLFVF